MVYIILLNWNGWKDTIHCLESVMRSDYHNYRVIVCDNESSDGSLEKIKAWAEGKQPASSDLDEQLKPLIFPGIEKPVPYAEYLRHEAEMGGNETDKDIPLILIRNGSNRGFSAGNNVGIRYALQKQADYIWLLNNDTLVKGNTLTELIKQLQSDKATGITGAVIYLAAQPTKIQTYGGGTISPCTGRDRFISSPGNLAYVAGTSLLVKRDVLEQVGLLDEEFFFYWEDVDFSRRAVKAGWKLAVAGNAIVYHKFSASVGGQSLKSDLFKIASLTHYFKKHHKKGKWLAPVSINIAGMLFNRIIRGQINRVKPIIIEALKALKILIVSLINIFLC